MKFNTEFSFPEIKTIIESNDNLKITFRYFSSRDEKCFDNHFYHFILTDPDPVGYGHLDLECGKMWLGMCVFDSFIGKGYGKVILKNLIDNRQDKAIHLSVDKENIKAINLYLHNGFKIYSQTEKIFYCILE